MDGFGEGGRDRMSELDWIGLDIKSVGCWWKRFESVL